MFLKKRVEEPVIQVAEEPAAEMLKPESEIEFPQPEPRKKEDKPEPSDTTLIGKGIVFYGDFSGDDPIVVNGSVNGDINTTNSLTVNNSGSYKGSANIADLHVDGKAEGEINCENLSVLGEKSVVKGQLITSYLESHKGSSFKGSLKLTGLMDAEDSSEEEAPAPAPAKADEQPAEETKAAEDPVVEKLSDDPFFALDVSALSENIKAPDLFGKKE